MDVKCFHILVSECFCKGCRVCSTLIALEIKGTHRIKWGDKEQSSWDEGSFHCPPVLD